jgi:Ca-activated chloride channel family protein
MRRRTTLLLPLLLAACLAAAAPARACKVALLLAMDVSGSVDAAEYRLQVEGLTLALADPDVRAALEAQAAAVAVMQWSGPGQQALSVPWRAMTGPAAIDALRAEAAAMPRAFFASGTAPGDAIRFAMDRLAAGPDCARRVIDISGDGDQNAGSSTAAARAAAEAAGVEINAIAIEEVGAGLSVTNFYRRHGITRGGFVLTARSHRDYARTFRAKLLRELLVPSG